MTIFRATVLDTPGEPEEGLRCDQDCALVVQDGVILQRTDYPTARAEYPEDEVVDLRDGLLLPGLIDTHVHYPQVRIIGGLGMPLLDWLETCALPEESRLAQAEYARGVAHDFLSGLIGAGTTTALVFGSHFHQAMDIFFEEADASGLRITSGLVVSDRVLRDDLLVTPEKALEYGQDLASRWHGHHRLRYAVTPRFSLSASSQMLHSCSELLSSQATSGPEDDGLWFTTHLNENPEEIAQVARFFPESENYLSTYDQHGLVTARSVFAHNVHPTEPELAAMAAQRATAAHCPSSNFALGSGLFPLREHLQSGVRVSLGSDVGAGTGFSLFKEGLQAYQGQQLLGDRGVQLSPANLLHLATRSGARALGLADQVGALSAGMAFDAIWVKPESRSVLQSTLNNARDAEDALAKVFALGTPADVETVWVGGEEISDRSLAAV